MNGEGNFNWRFVFPFQYMPAENMVVIKKKEHFWSLDTTEQRLRPNLILQVWDNDLFNPDDFLGSVELDLAHMPEPAKKRGKCTLETVDTAGDKKKTINIFECKRTSGFYPFSNLEDGKPVLTVSEVQYCGSMIISFPFEYIEHVAYVDVKLHPKNISPQLFPISVEGIDSDYVLLFFWSQPIMN